MIVWGRIAEAIGAGRTAALVTIMTVDGSSPREAGARMVVQDDGFFGTIGGGALEYQLLERARAMLSKPLAAEQVRQALGPDLGQCCGGQVTLALETFGPGDLIWIRPLAEAEAQGAFATLGQRDDAGRLIRRLSAPGVAVAPGLRKERFGVERTPLLLFGAGHVGRALALALAPLPFRMTWVDSRSEAFPAHAPASAQLLHLEDPRSALDAAAPGTLVAVVTHSHALDLALVARALGDERFAYVGLIGSATKRARFLRQLGNAGIPKEALARLVCPIGGARLRDKSPAVIAAAVVVELLEMRERLIPSDAF